MTTPESSVSGAEVVAEAAVNRREKGFLGGFNEHTILELVMVKKLRVCDLIFGGFLVKKRVVFNEEDKEGRVFAKPRKVVAISMDADNVDDAMVG